MNKKIILSFLIILCLLTSINFVLADENGSADTSIDDVDEKVGAAPTTEVSYSSSGSSMVAAPSGDISIDLQVIWNGGSAPDSVDVKILKDGAVVKTVALSEDNDWKATVELPMYDDNGNEITYDVEEADVDGFEASYTGDQEKGFIITNSPADSPLKASDSDVVGDDAPTSDGQGGSDDGSSDGQGSSDGSDDTANQGTETPTSDDQPTEVPIADSINNDTDDGNSTSDNNNTQPVNKTVKVVKKVVKVQDKDKKPEPKPMPPAGNPIAVLVLVLIGIVFASMRRRRD